MSMTRRASLTVYMYVIACAPVYIYDSGPGIDFSARRKPKGMTPSKLLSQKDWVETGEKMYKVLLDAGVDIWSGVRHHQPAL